MFLGPGSLLVKDFCRGGGGEEKERGGGLMYYQCSTQGGGVEEGEGVNCPLWKVW